MSAPKQGLSQRPFDILICIYYGIQIPLALLLDSQAVLPTGWFPEEAVSLNDWYIQKHQDPLVSLKPGWFIGCGYFELFIQVPFFAIATYCYALGKDSILLPNLVFSSASAALMIPIMSELILCQQEFNRLAVLSFYAPFALMPLLIAFRTYARLKELLSRHSNAAHSKSL